VADPWTYALSLDKAVEEKGVAQAQVAQEAYEGVKPLMRQVWQGVRWPNLFQTVRSQGQALLPARVLLGYLRGYFLYREIPENDRAFWPNFLKDLGIEDQDTPTPSEYDRLWEVLQRHQETRACLRLSEGGKQDFVGTLDAVFHFKALRLRSLKDAFLSFYQSGALPEQARSYERVFRRLRTAVEVLLAETEPPDLHSQEAVLRFLQEAGVYLGEPNPVRLLFNRSGQALHELYWKLRGRPPVKPQGSAFRHKQVRVEALAPSEGLEVEAVRPALSREPLLEGWRVYGQVNLADGRFKRFAWVPRFSAKGDPIPEALEVSFEVGEVVRFYLHHQAFAVRFSQPVWRPGEPLEVLHIGFDPAKHPLRFLLESGGEAKTRLEELAEAVGEGGEDRLIVEVRTDGQKDEWRRIGVLPVEVRTSLMAWLEPQGVFVRTHPPGLPVWVRVQAAERLLREGLQRTEAQGALVAQPALAFLQVEVALGAERFSFVLPPRGWPRGWWRLGLGFSRLRPLALVVCRSKANCS